jgi:hypothetical protein
MLVSDQIKWVNYQLGQDTSTTATKYVSDAHILEWLKEALYVMCVQGKVWDTYKLGGITLATGIESYNNPSVSTTSTTVTTGSPVNYTTVTNIGSALFTTASLLTNATHVRVAGPVYFGDYYIINASGTNPYYCQLTSVSGNTDYLLGYLGASATGTRTITPLLTAETSVGVECVEIIDIKMQATGESLTKSKPFQRGKQFISGTTPIWYFDFSNKTWFQPTPTATENGLLVDVFFYGRPTDTLVASSAVSGQIDGTSTYPIPIPDKWHPLMATYAAAKGKIAYRLFDEASVLIQQFSQQLGLNADEVKGRMAG